MTSSLRFFTLIFILSYSCNSLSSDITDTYSDGQTLTTTTLNNIKSSVNSKQDKDSVTGINFSADSADYYSSTSTVSTVDSVSLTLPDAGYVMVSFSANVRITHTTTAIESIRFAITDDPAFINFNNETSMRFHSIAAATAGGDYYMPTATQRVYTIPSAGSYTFYVRTDSNQAATKITRYGYHNLQALFIPNTY